MFLYWWWIVSLFKKNSLGCKFFFYSIEIGWIRISITHYTPGWTSLVMNWVPYHNIRLSSCNRCADSESVLFLKTLDQKKQNLSSFLCIWQKCLPSRASILHPVSNSMRETVVNNPCVFILKPFAFVLIRKQPRKSPGRHVANIVSIDPEADRTLEIALSLIKPHLNAFLVKEMMLVAVSELDHIDLFLPHHLPLLLLDLFFLRLMDAFIEFTHANWAVFLLIDFPSFLQVFLQKSVKLQNCDLDPVSHLANLWLMFCEPLLLKELILRYFLLILVRLLRLFHLFIPRSDLLHPLLRLLWTLHFTRRTLFHNFLLRTLLWRFWLSRSQLHNYWIGVLGFWGFGVLGFWGFGMRRKS